MAMSASVNCFRQSSPPFAARLDEQKICRCSSVRELPTAKTFTQEVRPPQRSRNVLVHGAVDPFRQSSATVSRRASRREVARRDVSFAGRDDHVAA